MKIEDRLSDALHGYADGIEPEPGSWARIEARLDDAPSPRRPSRRPFVLAGVALALIVVLIAVLAVLAVLAVRDDGDGARVATDGGAVTAMPSRIFATTGTGQFVIIDSTTGTRTLSYDFSVAAGARIAVTPNGQDAYVSSSANAFGNDGCTDHTIVRLPVGTGARGGAEAARNATDPTVSPDGRYLAYLHCGSGEARSTEIVLRDLTTGEERTTTAPSGTFFVDRLEFTADSRHVIFNFVDDVPGSPSTLRELDVVNGEAPPGRDVGVAAGGQGWVGIRGTTGQYLGVKGSPPAVLFMQGPSPFTAGPLFTLPAVPTQVVSDRSGDHLLAIVGHSLYRWSVGDTTPTKLVGEYSAAAWIPDVPSRPEPANDSPGLPTGVLTATVGGEVESMDASTGETHENLASLPRATAIDPIGPDGLTAVYATSGGAGTCADEPRPTIGKLVLASRNQTRIVSSAKSPAVSPDGRFVAYGIQCDGVALGYSDLRNGKNYRIGLVPSTEALPVDAVEPLAWAPDSERLLYRTVRDGETPRYYVGRLWPLAADTGAQLVSAGQLITAAAFIDGQTLAIAEDVNGGSVVKPLDLHELPDRAPLFSLPQRITSLVADASGHHFLAVTSDHSLYRWSTGDRTPTKLADDVVSAGWIPWS